MNTYNLGLLGTRFLNRTPLIVFVSIIVFSFSPLSGRLIANTKLNTNGGTLFSKNAASVRINSMQAAEKQFLSTDSLHLDMLTDDQFLERIQYDYTRKCLEKKDSLCTIENDGFRISLYCIAVNNKWMSRQVAASEVLQYLREFKLAKTACGIMPRTFDRITGEKANINYWTFGRPYDVVGTAFMATSLKFVIRQFFNRNTPDENEIRRLCNEICDRIDWNFAYDNNRKCFTWFKNGENGYLFDGKELLGEMDETFFLQLMVLGSKAWKHGDEAYQEYLSKVFIDSQYGYSYYGTKEYNYKETGNLKYMQINNPIVLNSKDYPMAKLGYLVQPHIWFNLGGYNDNFCRQNGMDYFQSVQNAIKAQIEYSKRNPGNFPFYGKVWGFYDTYSLPLKSWINKGLPAEGDIDEGTISIDAAISAVLFEPKEAIACLRTLYKEFKKDGVYTSGGWVTSINTPTREVSSFFCDSFFPPVNVLLIENYRTGLIWKLAKSAPEYKIIFKTAGLKKSNNIKKQ